ncbi:MAG: isocitrate/isopropylmalate dehydrogenase family protein, partial [Candidatus Bathyarchaeia archaeon]
MSRRYKVVVLPGDGIGREVVPEAVKILKAVEEFVAGLELSFEEYECGFEYYKKSGEPWSEEAYSACRESDAILYGAVGLPGVRGLEQIVYMHRHLRTDLDLYANIRPVKLRENVRCPLAGKRAGDIDLVIVRENTEDLYAPIRGSLTRADVEEVALDVKMVTRKGSERVIRQAFELCRGRGRGAPADGKRRMTCVDKSSWLYADKLFRSAFEKVAECYSDVEREHVIVDVAAMMMTQDPRRFDLIVTPDIYGDILSGIVIAQIGGLGMAPSGNIGEGHAIFEPVHGTAPDIAGRGIANPVAMILSAGLMLEWLGE